MNAEYQKLIERLALIKNRHTALQEENVIKNMTADIIILSQDRNSLEQLTRIKTQINVLNQSIKSTY